MIIFQMVFGTLLVGLLAVVTFLTLKRQTTLLREVRDGVHPDDESDHLRRRAYRRIVGGVLTAALGLLLAGALLFLELPAQEFADVVDHIPEAQRTPEQRAFAEFYGWYWVVVLLLLLLLLVLAAVDFFSERRHGLRQLRRLQDDRRALLAAEAAEARRRRAEEF